MTKSLKQKTDKHENLKYNPESVKAVRRLPAVCGWYKSNLWKRWILSHLTVIYWASLAPMLSPWYTRNARDMCMNDMASLEWQITLQPAAWDEEFKPQLPARVHSAFDCMTATDVFGGTCSRSYCPFIPLRSAFFPLTILLQSPFHSLSLSLSLTKA